MEEVPKSPEKPRSGKLSGNASTRAKKMLFLKALEKQMGNVMQAERSLENKGTPVSRRSHSRWLSNDEEYKARVEEAEFRLKEFAEAQLISIMNDKEHPGHATTVRFACERYYSEKYGRKDRIDHTSKGEKIQTPNVIFAPEPISVPDHMKDSE